ncbi:MAG: hypothetical protein AABX10_03025 [Nanoarchaeota archaeon]
MEDYARESSLDDSLLYFSLQDLFVDEQRRIPEETVSSGSKRSYSLRPLDRLIREEERDHLKKQAHRLQQFLFKNLDLEEYAFLSGVLGRDWVYRLRLPLEFREFSKGEFLGYLSARKEEFKEKIGLLMEHVKGVANINQAAALQEAIRVPYSLASTKKIIEVYEGMQKGTFITYPKGYLHPENHRVPKVLTRHLVDNLLAMSRSEQTVRILKPEDFREYGLGFVLEQHYGGNTKQALQSAYSAQEFPAAHSKPYDDDEILREVFLQLDSSKNGKVKHG